MSRISKEFTTVWNEATRTIIVTPSGQDRICIDADRMNLVPEDRHSNHVTVNNDLHIDWTKDTSLSAIDRDDFISKMLALKTPVVDEFINATFNTSTLYTREVLLGNLNTFSTSEVTFGNIQNWTKMTTTETMNVVSSSTDDDIGGVGANSIYVIGIDDDGAIAQETVLMDGTTNVVTTNSYKFINRIYVTSCGSTGYNVGNITLTATTAGTVQGYVRASVSISEEMRYMVPIDRSGAWVYNIYDTDKSSNTERVMTVKAYVYPGTIPTVRVLAGQTKQSSDLNDTLVTRPFSGILDPGTIIYWTAVSDGTATTARGTIGLFFKITQ